MIVPTPALTVVTYPGRWMRAQRRLVAAGVALVQPQSAVGLARGIGRAAVADVVFGAGHDGERIGQVGALEAADRGRAQDLHDVGALRISFVGPAPAYVAGDGHARREDPVDAGGADFRGRDPLDLLHKFSIAAQPRPMLCGKITAPGMLLCPWTASTP